MASKRFIKGADEYTFFTDYWNFCQKNWIPDSSEFWEKLLVDADKLTKKYSNTFECDKELGDDGFAVSTIRAFIDYLDAKDRLKRQNE